MFRHIIFFTLIFKNYYLGRCYASVSYRQMLCLADAVCHMRCGRCYNHRGRCYILLLFISGRCYCHMMLWKMLYLQWDSNHTVLSKYSVVGSLHYRAKTICSSPELLQQEEKHLKQTLTRCKYPAWAMNKVKMKTKATAKNNSRGTKNSGNNIQKPHMVIPYYKGISESIKKICSVHGVQVYFKGGNTIKNLLVAPKD